MQDIREALPDYSFISTHTEIQMTNLKSRLFITTWERSRVDLRGWSIDVLLYSILLSGNVKLRVKDDLCVNLRHGFIISEFIPSSHIDRKKRIERIVRHAKGLGW
jgi:hypothetical protein